MLRFVSLVALFVLFTCAQTVVPGYDDKVVIFYVVDPFGAVLPYRVGKMLEGDGRKEVTDHCQDNVCRDLKPGRYSYHLVSSEFGPGTGGEVDIFRAETVVTNIESRVETPGATIHGRISGLRRVRRPSWLRLQSLYEDNSVQVAVDNYGRFTLQHVHPGMWMIMLFEEGRLLLSKQIEFRPVHVPFQDLDISVTGSPAMIRFP